VRLQAHVRVLILEGSHEPRSITCGVWPVPDDFGGKRAGAGVVVNEVRPKPRARQGPVPGAGRGKEQEEDDQRQADLVKGLEARVLVAPDEGEPVGRKEGQKDAKHEGRHPFHLAWEPPREFLSEESEPGGAEQEGIENQSRARSQADAGQPGGFPLRPVSTAYISCRLQSDLPSRAPMVHGRPDPLFMHKPWARKRASDEVPTPVAVAVSDFCRRAGAPSSPSDVRDALSTLAADEDFRVHSLTETEPSARPLGPYAVVDVLGGTLQALAAQREACGYYQLVKAILEDEPRPLEPPGRGRGPASPAASSGAPPPSLPVKAVSDSPAASPASRQTPPAEQTVAERIAPKRRAAGSGGPAATLPRGRFAQLPSEQPTLDLLEPSRLSDLLTQHGHRPALLRALSTGRPQAISNEALDRALEAGGLLGRAIASEQELILSTLEEQRGAFGRAAWALGIRASELPAWAERLGITPAVDRIRDRFRREALQPAHWTARLDLLGKRKYLQDLGVSGDFERKVTEDLRRALDSTPGDTEERTAVLANRLGVSPEALRRSLLRLGLLPPAAPALSPQPPA
jgi:hypothetical protein